MALSFRDTRHPVEVDEDRRIAEAREKRVPLELKGLKANMLKLQARVDRLNGLAAAADEKGATLEDHLGAIGSQLGSHVEDIEFAANVLGNSGGLSADDGAGGEQKG